MSQPALAPRPPVTATRKAIEPMHLDVFIKQFEKQSEEYGLIYELGPPATAADIAAAERRLGVSFPEPVVRFFSSCDGLQVVEPHLKINALDQLKFIGDRLIHLATFDKEHRLAFDVSEVNQADQWSIVNADTGYRVTFSMASFWTNKVWAWIDRRRTVWEEETYDDSAWTQASAMESGETIPVPMYTRQEAAGSDGSEWLIWCVTKNEYKAQKLLKRVAAALECEPLDVRCHPDVDIPGFSISFRLPIEGETWAEKMLWLLDIGNRVADAWIVQPVRGGSIRKSACGFSDHCRITGVRRIQWDIANTGVLGLPDDDGGE